MRVKPVCVCLSAVMFTCRPSLGFGACDGRLEGVGHSISIGDYDPYDAADFRRRQSLTVRNTGTEQCSFVVGFWRQPAEGRLSGALSYKIENASGASLLSSSPPTTSGVPYLAFLNIPPSQTVSADYYIALPRGQYAWPGSYYDNDVKLALHSRSSQGAINADALDIDDLVIQQQVMASVGINVAGGGLTTTLNFGELASGKERSVFLQTRANHAYQLALRSTNGSRLKLDPEVPGQIWSIPYSLRVNSQSVSLQAVALLGRSRPSDWGGEESHALSFRIEDAGDRRAGLYRDTVTVEISVQP
jgi:hypothetical protein